MAFSDHEKRGAIALSLFLCRGQVVQTADGWVCHAFKTARSGLLGLILALLLALSNRPLSWAADDAAVLQQHFEQRYQSYFTATSQALLPLPTLDKSAWKRLRAKRTLQPVFVAPDRYYNAKLYTLTLFQDEDGVYYLEAQGGFWGMDTLVYGPLRQADLE